MGAYDTFSPNALLFHRLFVEFVQSIFFKHPEIRFRNTDMFNHMPPFYQDYGMVDAALHLLMMEGKIIQSREPTGDFYQANPEAIESIKRDARNKKLSEEFEIEIKQRTIDSLKWQRIPMKYWWAIAIITLALGWFADLGKDLVLKTVKETTQVQSESVLPDSSRAKK